MEENNEWLLHLKSRDEEAFRYLVDNYKDIVLRTALGYVKNIDDAEDVVQEVFISIFEHIDSFRGDANIKTWIYRIAINKSINATRKAKWKSAIQNLESFLSGKNNFIADKSNPLKELMIKEQDFAINRILESLPENQRVAFVLHKFDDLSHLEISEIMKISISAVESLIHRAKQNLQKKINLI